MFNSSPCSISDGLYEDYTSGARKSCQKVEMEPGTDYDITMRLDRIMLLEGYIKVFIDYNQDGKYDIINPAGEKEMVYANTLHFSTTSSANRF